MSDRTIHDILRDAGAIAAMPDTGEPIPGFPCVVAGSLSEIDPNHITLIVHQGHPVFVYPKGTRPMQAKERE